MTTPHNKQDTARRVAGLLLDAGCVSVRGEEPFRLPSGWASPVYMDCRRLISFPAIRRELVALGLQRLRADGGLEGVRAIAGAETSGIALAAWMAESLELPLLVVRKQPTAQTPVEGVVEPGACVLLVDDLMAAGASKLKFCGALARAGAQVRDLFVVFDYGSFDTAARLSPLGVRAHALATWADVLVLATERAAFDAAALAELGRFLHNPPAWSLAHGGIGGLPSISALS
ncbi:orotate phosphoribosyltransferase [Xylophilus sp. GOD-11R]|uniref:orotate phosphoribosyltransferase n=1 Tax=Xylophilus sp. GOD-11R TaxID=3089814 RepID=UPI00298CC571|nr:orotate phosphoribosyltransferase [Xylophilus sp. GOD-11R]WPB56675.1 orotate phosphoribosyltransferase [Xylophilus sp. GOD-11R]